MIDLIRTIYDGYTTLKGLIDKLKNNKKQSELLSERIYIIIKQLNILEKKSSKLNECNEEYLQIFNDLIKEITKQISKFDDQSKQQTKIKTIETNFIFNILFIIFVYFYCLFFISYSIIFEKFLF
jgi:hypothetical protein